MHQKRSSHLVSPRLTSSHLVLLLPACCIRLGSAAQRLAAVPQLLACIKSGHLTLSHFVSSHLQKCPTGTCVSGDGARPTHVLVGPSHCRRSALPHRHMCEWGRRPTNTCAGGAITLPPPIPAPALRPIVSFFLKPSHLITLRFTSCHFVLAGHLLQASCSDWLNWPLTLHRLVAFLRPTTRRSSASCCWRSCVRTCSRPQRRVLQPPRCAVAAAAAVTRAGVAVAPPAGQRWQQPWQRLAQCRYSCRRCSASLTCTCSALSPAAAVPAMARSQLVAQQLRSRSRLPNSAEPAVFGQKTSCCWSAVRLAEQVLPLQQRQQVRPRRGQQCS